jgi:CBS domain containing-hemolysin-like protein
MAGRIPREGEVFLVDNRQFTIIRSDERQIWSIRIDPIQE